MGGDPLHLRPALPDDEPFLFDLYASTREDVRSWGLPPAQAEAMLRMQHQARARSYRMEFPGAEDQIVLVDGAPAGRLCVDRTGAALRLVDVALLPRHRGRGLGGRLVEAVLEEARAGRRAVELHVLEGNPAARLYRRLGFAFVEPGGESPYRRMRWEPGEGREGR